MVALVLVNSLRREVTSWREKSRRGAPRDVVTPGSVERVDPVSGGAQFEFSRLQLEARYVADDVLLLSWGPGPAPVPYAIAGERSVPPAPSVLVLDRGTGGWDLISEALVLHVGVDGGTEVRCRDGTVLRRAAPPVRRGGSWEQDSGMRPGERFSGLGEQSSRVDLRGGKFDLWNRDAGGAWGPGAGPLYFGVPAVLATHPEGNVLTFYENSTRAVFSFGDPAAPRDQEGRASVVFEGGRLRSYVIAGSVPHLLDRYSELTGRPSLPPRWALGYHQSRWGYRSASEVRGVLDGYAREELPLSAVHLDIDYMDGYRVFTVDRSRFGDISELASDAEQSGTRVVTILDPGVKVDPRYDLYRQGQVLATFCRDTHGNPVRGVVWPGRVVFPDFTDPRARTWWAGHYSVLTGAGVGGCWHDMNEPASISIVGDPTLPLDVRHDLDGRGGDHAEAHNLYGLLMNRAGYEGLALARPDRRPFILSRSGWAGNQRWAWSWTGDTESSWSSMRQQVATVIGLGLSGIPFTGSDIGGFSGVPDDDLYLRWLQMSVFTGLCRTHSVVGAPLREPWRFAGLTRRRIGAWIRFRYRLLPYLYTLAHEAAISGAPLVRPLWWPPPADADDVLSTEPARRGLGDQDDAFMLGDALLVAPVFEPGARRRRVVLPPGSWEHLWDCDEIVPGAAAGHDPGAHEGAGPSGADGLCGVAVEMSAPADRLPVLVRSGTILPLDDGFADPSGPCRLEDDPAASVPTGRLGMDHAPRLLSFHCWPSSRGTARGFCTDDAGDGFGPVRRDELRLEGGVPGSTAVLTWLSNGEFPPPSRVRIVIHGADSARVVADGHDIGGTVGGSIECVPFHRLELRDLTPAGRSVPPGARR
jgi:alpha-glucosidase